MDTYLIGDILLKSNINGVQLAPGKYMDKFKYSEVWNGDCIIFNGTTEPLEPYLQNKITKDNGVYEIYSLNEKYVYAYHWGKLFHGFIIHPNEFTATFAPEMINQVPVNADWFFGVSGFHQQLLKHGAPILHASYIEYQGKGLVFTAPSQTGKSTQASLWEQHAGAKIVNGDRVLLRRKNEIWHTYGFPCCGSSQICENRTLPLAAIICLKQGQENLVEKTTLGEKIRALASGIECYRWDENEINFVFDYAEQIAKEIPMFRLTCQPNANAVLELQDYLIKEDIFL